jgi:putative ABC transport system substrate-binding protein
MARVSTFPMNPMRRRLLGALAVAPLAFPRSGRSAVPGRFRIVVFNPATEQFNRENENTWNVADGFSAALAELGYVDGRNLEVVSLFDVSTPEERASQLARARSARVDAIVVIGGGLSPEWDRVMQGVPIVAWGVMDPVEEGIAKSFTRPGGNITGTTQGWQETCRKQVDILLRLVPGLTGIAVFYGYGNPQPLPYIPARELELLQFAVREAGLKVLTVRSASFGALMALESLRRHGFQAAIYGTPPGTLKAASRHAEAAIRARIATITPYSSNKNVERGFLAGYGELDTEFAKRVAQQLDRIFRGTKPGDIPFIHPSRYHLRLNRRTAAALGLVIPPDVLLMADRVVE